MIVKVNRFMPGPSRHQAACQYLRYIANPARHDVARWEETLRQRDVESEASVYALHIQERRGSQGLFGPELNGPVSEADLEQVFGQHEGPIWHLIVSVHREDAERMGGRLLGRAAWEDACRDVLPALGRNMGIPMEDLRWVAAMHLRPKDGSPHAHILVWSADPEKGLHTYGKVLRYSIPAHSLDLLKRDFVRVLYAPERVRLGAEKALVRQGVMDQARAALSYKGERILSRQLQQVAAMLPGEGRLAYAYMPAAVKRQVDKIAAGLLQETALAPLAKRFGDLAAELATHYATDPQRHDAARQNAFSDLQGRLGGIILRAAVSLDEGAAWQLVVEDVWQGLHQGRATPPEIAEAVREAVRQAGRDTTGQQAKAAARALLARPELAPLVEALLAKHAQMGDPGTAHERQAKVQARLVSVVATRLQRNGQYVRSLRSFRVRAVVGTLLFAFSVELAQREREQRRAAREWEKEPEEQAKGRRRAVEYEEYGPER
ncbi:MAG: relaxase MobL [Sulfobacillus sp.]